MSVNTLIIIFAALFTIALIAIVIMQRWKRRFGKRLQAFREEVIAASADASVGRRLSVSDRGDIADLASTINRLFDALGERDEEIQDRDRLFTEFVQTLPEVVLIHGERIILANERAAGLLGMTPDQLVGRDVADLIKPAYRALFRKSVANRLAGENVPRRLEIQLINGNEQGLWVEAQSSIIEYQGTATILTIARDVSYRKSLEASLSRSKRQAQYTLESISEGVITTDNEGRIDSMNRPSEVMTAAESETSCCH